MMRKNAKISAKLLSVHIGISIRKIEKNQNLRNLILLIGLVEHVGIGNLNYKSPD